jgi:hypothetical protein
MLSTILNTKMIEKIPIVTPNNESTVRSLFTTSDCVAKAKASLS